MCVFSGHTNVMKFDTFRWKVSVDAAFCGINFLIFFFQSLSWKLKKMRIQLRFRVDAFFI